MAVAVASVGHFMNGKSVLELQPNTAETSCALIAQAIDHSKAADPLLLMPAWQVNGTRMILARKQLLLAVARSTNGGLRTRGISWQTRPRDRSFNSKCCPWCAHGRHGQIRCQNMQALSLHFQKKTSRHSQMSSVVVNTRHGEFAKGVGGIGKPGLSIVLFF